MTNILVIDQGTHATRAILFSAQGEMIDQAEKTISLHRIDHQQVEQDAQEILDSVWYVIRNIAQRHTIDHTTRCALTTQRSTILAWDKTTGRPLYQALSWQDRRAQEDLLSFSHHADRIKRITGLPLSPHYGAGKCRWLLNHHPEIHKAFDNNKAHIGPLASFLLWHLLESHPYVVDFSNAHRMQLFELQHNDWSAELIQLFSLSGISLPQCQPLIHVYGSLRDYGCVMSAVCGDQTAAFHGLGPLPAETAVVNIGTGAFILAPCNRVITDTPLLCGVHANGYLLEGTVNGAGASLEWAQQHWPVVDLFTHLPHWLETETDIPVFINTVGGLGSPWWRDGGPPHFREDTAATPASRYVAIAESLIFLLQHNIESLRLQLPVSTLKIGGGLARLDGLCQKLANLSKCKIIRNESFETTAKGAAWLAAQQPSNWFNQSTSQHFTPRDDTGLTDRYRTMTRVLHKS